MMEKYNLLLRRYHRAVKWLDDPVRTEEEREKYIDNFREILQGLNFYLKKIKETGINLTSKQILEGFNDIKNEEMGDHGCVQNMNRKLL